MAWYHEVAALRSSLNWYRSWPKEIPAGRAHVIDSLPRLVMTDCDYLKIEGGWPDDRPGLCLLEWDMALDLEGRSTFAEIAEATPDKPLVAPYSKNYGTAVRGIQRNHGHIPIAKGETSADFFGLGCIYLPWRVVVDFLATRPAQFTDLTLSTWYRRNHGRIDVTWDVIPQHLHGD